MATNSIILYVITLISNADLREKIIDALEKGDSSIRKVAQRFGVSKN